MNKKYKIAYCIPSLYYPSGMERVFTLKANYSVEHFGYEIHMILTDGKNKEPHYKLHTPIIVHQLDIGFDKHGHPLPKLMFTCPCGPRDIIDNGKDGFIIENFNIEKMAEKTCYLIENE